MPGALPASRCFAYHEGGIRLFRARYGRPSGVYVIQLAGGWIPYPFRRSRILYIGTVLTFRLRIGVPLRLLRSDKIGK